MNNIQALVDGWNAQMMRERSETQMTLGKLIDRLDAMPPESPLTGIVKPHSYRGYYSDLAFEMEDANTTAKAAAAMCRGAMGEVFEGYKGGDFQMGRNTPVWIAAYGCTGFKLLSVRDNGTLELGEQE